MLKLIAFGLCVGAGVQAWRQWPADGPVTVEAGVLVMIVAVAAAFLGGLWWGRVRSSSWASAYAEARATARSESKATAQQSQTVNLVVVEKAGAGSARDGGVRTPDELTPWMGGARREVSADELDGMDLSELVRGEEQDV